MHKKSPKDSRQKGIIRFNAMWLVLRSILGIAFAFSNVALGQLSRSVYDDALLSGSEQMLWKLGGSYLLSIFAFLILYIMYQFATVYINERSAEKIRTDAYSSFLHLSFPAMEKFRSGDLVTRIISDVDNMKQLGGVVYLDILNGLLMLIILLWWMFSVNWLLAMLLLPAPLLFSAAIMLFGTKMYKVSEKLQTLQADTNQIVGQTVAGSHTIKLLLLNALTKQRFSQSISKLSQMVTEMDLINVKMQSVWNLVMIPYEALFFLVAGWIYIRQGTPSIGTMLAFSNFASFLIYPLMSLLGSLASIGKMIPSKNRVQEILDGMQDDDSTSPVAQTVSSSEDICLRNVNFTYPNGEKVLKDVCITIPKQTTTIIWGRSGSGKSTIAKLIIGLYKPDSGEIQYRGEASDVVNTTVTRKRISYLEQQPFIFEASILENILLGEEDKNVELVKVAATNVRIHEVIEHLHQKYDTVLNEKTPLSGGEKQRLAMARCFVHDSDIFVLDEPTAFLDKTLSLDIIRSLTRNYPNCTKVIITHNPDLLRYADYCVVLEKGSVLYEGRPNEMPIHVSELSDPRS